MAASLRMFRRQQFPREAQQIRIAARPSTSLRIDPGTSPVGFDRHAGRSSKPSAVSVRKGGRALDREKAPVIVESYARPDRSGSSGLSTARTSPRTALSTRVCVQIKKALVSSCRQPPDRIQKHSAFAVSAAICLRPSPAGIPLAACGSQERCELAHESAPHESSATARFCDPPVTRLNPPLPFTHSNGCSGSTPAVARV
jgi:hypothetical protein